jgi:4-hydroxy-3-methylbut-2-enyl diphosphate reductase
MKCAKDKHAIYLARTAGFCFGVRRAIRIAHELARKDAKMRSSATAHKIMAHKKSGTTSPGLRGGARGVHMLGDLVHNQTVISELEKAGIKKISRLCDGRNKILLIRAHGAGKRLMAMARKRGYHIADATCPMVRAIHKIVRKMDQKGYQIIVLGDRRHDEVQGIVGQISRKTLIIDSIKNIPWALIKKIRKAAIVVQSTQNIDHILPIVETLEANIKEIKFFNTICRPTRMKQAEMKNLPARNDVVIIIGSRESANTRRLFEISRDINPRSYRIESAGQIKPRWFRKARSIGITAGASTPESVTRSVIGRIRKILKHIGEMGL